MRLDLIALMVVTVYKSPTCQCCAHWIDRMKTAGFTVQAVDVENPGALQTIKRDHGITPRLGSCHTAIVDGYVIEGHVPPEDVKKLLHDHPKGIIGLAAPGMPNGAPGMEVPGAADHYDVLALTASGTSVYDRR